MACISRRVFLHTIPWLAGSAALPRVTHAADSIVVTSQRRPGESLAVDVLLEVGGDLKLQDQGRTKQLKMSVVGRMGYIERWLERDAERSTRLGARRYETADAVIKIDLSTHKPALRAERRLIGVSTDPQAALLFSPEGTLTREELDLLEVPANSLLVDDLLPGRAIVVGDRWQHTNEFLAQFLAIDAVQQSDVFSELKELDGGLARIELAGSVNGAVHGVVTDMKLQGRYKFDARTGGVSWLALLIEEERSIGHVGPGASVTSRLQMTLRSAETPLELNDESVKNGLWNTSQAFTSLEYRSERGGYTLHHDRRWHVMSDQAESVVLRLVDRGHFVAQCNVSSLPKVGPGKHVTLEKFQLDIQQALGDKFRQFVQASEGVTQQGYVLYRVVGVGQVSELPIQWNYYLLADREGHQAVLAFTIEDEQVPRLAESDAMLAESLTFFEPTTTATTTKLTR